MSSNSLTIINGTVQDSGDYACVAEVSLVSVSSNVARLTVYGKSNIYIYIYMEDLTKLNENRRENVKRTGVITSKRRVVLKVNSLGKKLRKCFKNGIEI